MKIDRSVSDDSRSGMAARGFPPNPACRGRGVEHSFMLLVMCSPSPHKLFRQTTHTLTSKRDMDQVSTARILADKALQNPCGQECVDWAVSMLEQGQDGRHLVFLAGMAPPHNHFELAELRDRALEEVGVIGASDEIALRRYAAEELQRALAGEADLVEILRAFKDLCVGNDYRHELYDLYLLYFAYTDLLDSGEQHYWPGATRKNILPFIREQAEQLAQDPPHAA